MNEFFKVLDEKGKSFHGGKGQWHLPQNGQPGQWMDSIQGKLIACQNGYHVCKREQLLGWLGPSIYTIEIDGEIIEEADKCIVRRARLLHKLNWNMQQMILFAADCVEHVLPIFEKQYPGDLRPHTAINAARAAGAAAGVAAGVAAGAAAGAAAWAAGAAGAAAWAAAWDAEREWQNETLERLIKEKLEK